MDGGRTRRHLGAILLTIGVLSTAGLVACTDDGPSVNPSTTTTGTAPAETSTPSSTAKLPTAPKAEPTPKSAEAFVKYFWDVYNYSYATLDPEPLSATSKSTCDFCSSAVKEIETSKARKLTNKGGTITPRVVAAPPGKIKDFVVVSSVLQQDSAQVLDSNGQVLSTSPPLSAAEAQVRLEWQSGAWIVAAINIKQHRGQP